MLTCPLDPQFVISIIASRICPSTDSERGINAAKHLLLSFLHLENDLFKKLAKFISFSIFCFTNTMKKSKDK